MKYFLAACAAWSLWLAAAQAHEGHDHGAPALPPAAAATLSPRMEASSADFELLATLEAGQLVVWLDRWRDNAPIANAKIEVEATALKGVLAPRADGAYVLAAPALAAGDHPLVFSIETADAGDLLNGVLSVPTTTISPTGSPVLWGAAALGAILLLGALWFWRRKRS